MKFALKQDFFFAIQVIKMKIKGVIKALKNQRNDNSKIYLGISLELQRAVWGQFNFRQFHVPAYSSSRGLQAPSNVVSANYRVYSVVPVPSKVVPSVYFGLFCLQVSSVSSFCPDTRGPRWSLIQAHLFSCAVGREKHFRQISLVHVGSALSVWATVGLPLLMACLLSRSTLFRLQVALQGNSLKWALGCVHFPGLNHSSSGSWVLHKGTDLGGSAFCALPRSEQLR